MLAGNSFNFTLEHRQVEVSFRARQQKYPSSDSHRPVALCTDAIVCASVRELPPQSNRQLGQNGVANLSQQTPSDYRGIVEVGAAIVKGRLALNGLLPAP